MNSPLLSICIPTFNRASCLKQCLESISTQFEDGEVARLVEVVISDNGSSDNTEAVVKDFQSRFPNIAYSKNPQNLGFDRNALLLVEKAKGEFIWFMGDDDALFPGALKYILEKIQEQRFNYCVVNFWAYDNKLEQQALKNPNPTIKSDQYFPRLGDYVRQFNDNDNLVGFFCGLSVQIFKRSFWQEFAGKEKFIGTSAVHLYILMSALKDQPFATFAKPLVKARSDNIRWDTFSGLDTEKGRAQSTYKLLTWVLDFYQIPYSKQSLNFRFRVTAFKNWIRAFVRNKIFKSQKARDLVKKILGKL